MSLTLYFIPVVPKNGTSLSSDLKYILEKKYALNQGRRILTQEDIAYLQGLADASVKDADKLITAILRHSRVELYLEG
jgi:hypothetical protein